MKMYQVIEHPLIKHKITMLRDKTCSTKMFREVTDEISALMVYEISRDLKLKEKEIETPIAKTIGYELSQEIVIVPILRAGLGMTQGIQNLIPSLKVAHIGMYRDHDTHIPHVYYAKFPENIKHAKVFILDPLLATGGSVEVAIDKLKEQGAKDITVVSIIGVMEGINRIKEKHPEIMIYLGSLDERLNENAYIVPGVGDAGDRLFDTK
ncbi:MAG: uracil phosphoribosyltransferase [Acholeplasmataceae bacterium]|nr:uracil phosphoribosyltransferase [Acholeplasmataceae bacterium]